MCYKLLPFAPLGAIFSAQDLLGVPHLGGVVSEQNRTANLIIIMFYALVNYHRPKYLFKYS